MRLVVLGLIPFTVTAAGAEGATSATSRRPSPSAATTPEPPLEARAAIRRLFGTDTARRVVVTISGAESGRYDLGVAKGVVSVRAGSPVAAIRGVYAYLNKHGYASVSWEGKRVQLPRMLPDTHSTAQTALYRHRLYLNTCTYGYTTPFWDWSRWEREIDWMAANGIDMPLALEGQESVWQDLWRDEGLSDSELQSYFSGPAFLPWQRMGNIEGHAGPLPQHWIDTKRTLQRNILKRMRALGMAPILPGFAGYVPKAFAEKHPKSRIYRMRAWEGFHETYWLDPADPLFAKLSAKFIRHYTSTYGPGSLYLADAFNEMVPPISEDGTDARAQSYGDSTANKAAAEAVAASVSPAVRHSRLAAYGERLYRSIADAAPGATWVMQGWLFGADKRFWTDDSIAAFLSRVPDKGMMVLDIGNDRYPDIWRRTKAFDGKWWTFGYVHNYGGSNPVYGDLDFYRRDMIGALKDPNAGRLEGFGMFPEGLHSNSIVYAQAYDMANGDGGASLDAWLGRYVLARYGKASSATLAGWRDIAKSTYTTRYWTPRWWETRAGAYLFFKRPIADIGAYPIAPGDRTGLRRGIKALLHDAEHLKSEPLYVHDLIDLSRHYASLQIDEQVKAAVAAYRRRDIAGGDAAAAAMRDTAIRIDDLLGAQPEQLASWLAMASAYGTTTEDKRLYVANAKLQVSRWGGEGNLADYASKAWQGMYRGYYLPRWTMFLDGMRASALAGRTFDEAAMLQRIRIWEADWARDPTVPLRRRPADPVAGVRQLMDGLR
jgi:alpha-N-acetylglucosaminidase